MLEKWINLLTDPRLSRMFLILVSTLGSVRSWWDTLPTPPTAATAPLLLRMESWEEEPDAPDTPASDPASLTSWEGESECLASL